MSTSLPPPPPTSGNNTKYAVIGVILLTGAIAAIYVGLNRNPQPDNSAGNTPQAGANADAGSVTPPVHQIATQIVLDLDSGPPDTGAVASTDGGLDAGSSRPRPNPNANANARVFDNCSGEINPQAVSAAIRASYGGLRECYNRQLRVNPMFQGQITAEWVIQTNGQPANINLSGQLHGGAFRSCFSTALSRVRFPPARGSCARFRQSWTFRPEG